MQILIKKKIPRLVFQEVANGEEETVVNTLLTNSTGELYFSQFGPEATLKANNDDDICVSIQGNTIFIINNDSVISLYPEEIDGIIKYKINAYGDIIHLLTSSGASIAISDRITFTNPNGDKMSLSTDAIDFTTSKGDRIYLNDSISISDARGNSVNLNDDTIKIATNTGGKISVGNDVFLTNNNGDSVELDNNTIKLSTHTGSKISVASEVTFTNNNGDSVTVSQLARLLNHIHQGYHGETGPPIY